jgi:3-phenylpropionate/cinnamic acid dioxygenase small subunit
MTDSSTQVANLIAQYAELIDQGDFDGVTELLRDAQVGGEDGTSMLAGKEAIHRLFASTARLYPDGTPKTKHVTTNLILEIDEETGTAAARSYWTVFQAVEGLPLQPILAGRYLDRFEYQDEWWRFSERRYAVDLVGDISHHMLGNRPAG